MKKRSIKFNQTAVNVTVLVVIAVLFLYLGVQLSRGFSSTVTTQRTQTITDVEYLHARGYVFKSENVIERPYGGVCHYLTEDGQRVRADQSYVTYYKVSSGAEQKQSELDDLSRQIGLLTSKIASAGNASDLSHIGETISGTYYSYVDNLIDGNFISADKDGEALLGALVNQSVITEGKEDVIKNVIEPLEKERDQLLSSMGTGKTMSADEGGFYFFRETDGYENIFFSSKLDGLTRAELDKLINASPKKYSDKPIGKTSDTAEWFLVLPADESFIMQFAYPKPEIETETDTDTSDEDIPDGEASQEEYVPEFRIGQSYKVTFLEADREISMKLDSVRLEESGNGFLVFSSYDLELSMTLSRSQDVKINMDSTTGYRIPAESLVENDGENGVYILVGTVVEFRRVTVIGEGNGYYIVNTREKDRAENGEDGRRPEYLYVNDLIITSGNNLYDGKLLD